MRAGPLHNKFQNMSQDKCQLPYKILYCSLREPQKNLLPPTSVRRHFYSQNRDSNFLWNIGNDRLDYKILYILEHHSWNNYHGTGKTRSNGNSSKLYSWGVWFEYCLKHLLFWLRLSVVFLSSLQANVGIIPQISPSLLPSRSFQIHYLLSPINLTIHSQSYW